MAVCWAFFFPFAFVVCCYGKANIQMAGLPLPQKMNKKLIYVENYAHLQKRSPKLFFAHIAPTKKTSG